MPIFNVVSLPFVSCCDNATMCRNLRRNVFFHPSGKWQRWQRQWQQQQQRQQQWQWRQRWSGGGSGRLCRHWPHWRRQSGWCWWQQLCQMVGGGGGGFGGGGQQQRCLQWPWRDDSQWRSSSAWQTITGTQRPCWRVFMYVMRSVQNSVPPFLLFLSIYINIGILWVQKVFPKLVQKYINCKKGFDYGMELNSLIFQLMDGCPVVSGTKLYMFPNTWRYRGKPFFGLMIFQVRCVNVVIRISIYMILLLKFWGDHYYFQSGTQVDTVIM